MSPLTVMTVFGTRPEAVKMAPVVQELARRPRETRPFVVVTSQHREMLQQALDVFAIRPDEDLDVMSPNQSLTELTCRILARLDPVIARERPDVVLVQGDTTTTFAASLSAFYHKVAVGHIEAGLRTFHRYSPFPEEVNRRLTSSLATLHFAPTDLSRRNLLAEGVGEDAIAVTGNTVIDALEWVVRTRGFGASRSDGRRNILVTAHRRENWGAPLENICRAVLDILERHEDADVLFPVHLNPNVRATVHALLGSHPRIRLVEPLDYVDFAKALVECYLVLTDSGGVQEEAPALGKPVLVLRDTTERQEAVDAGTARLVGTRRADIVAAAEVLLDDPAAYEAMSRAVNPYGDGTASRRIVDTLLAKLGAA